MLWAVFFCVMLFSFLFSNACIKRGSLCIFLCRSSLFSQGSYYRTCVFVCAVCKCLLSFPLQGLRAGLVVKGMWGDKCQVFDSPQASNPGGRALGRHRAPLSFLMWPLVWSQSFPLSTRPETAERRKCGVGDDMKGKAGWRVSMRTLFLARWMWAQAEWFVTCTSLCKMTSLRHVLYLPNSWNYHLQVNMQYKQSAYICLPLK